MFSRLKRKLQVALACRQAKRGYLTAQYQIGKLYHDMGGAYLPQAFAWLTVASSHGHSKASLELVALEAQLPLDRLEEGRKLAAEYKQNYDSTPMRRRK